MNPWSCAIQASLPRLTRALRPNRYLARGLALILCAGSANLFAATILAPYTAVDNNVSAFGTAGAGASLRVGTDASNYRSLIPRKSDGQVSSTGGSGSFACLNCKMEFKIGGAWVNTENISVMTDGTYDVRSTNNTNDVYCAAATWTTGTGWSGNAGADPANCADSGGGGAGAGTDAGAKADSASKSTAAGFMTAGNNAQQFMVQTQIQNRLVNRMISRNTETALTGFTSKEGLQDLAAGQALASTYAAGIDRPSRTTWHSKDGLMGKLFGRSDEEREQQKRESETQGFASLTASGPASGGAYGDLSANARDSAAIPSSLRYDNQPYDVWASGGYTSVDSSATGNQWDGDLWFGRMGIDHLFRDNLLVGAFGGYDEGDADFTSLTTALDSEARVAGAYFGYLLTPAKTGLPVHLILDGQASYSDVDYSVRNTSNGTTGDFEPTAGWPRSM